jgi:hypothetical protein
MYQEEQHTEAPPVCAHTKSAYLNAEEGRRSYCNVDGSTLTLTSFEHFLRHCVYDEKDECKGEKQGQDSG